MEGNIGGNNSCTKAGVVGIEKKQGRPQEQLNCPRCNSSNTKFCYYNNYSLTQPRYFCKTCRRYWTEGGSLRSVPVGGGSRKNKKLSSSSSRLLPDLNPPTTTTASATLPSSQNPKILMQGGQDLNLAFPPMMEKYDRGLIGIGSTSSSSNSSSALELLRADMASRSLNNYGHPHSPILMMPNSNSNALFPSGFSYNHPMQEVKPSLGFPVDHHHHALVGSRYGVQEDISNGGGSGRLLFPFGDVKQISAATHHEVEQNKEQRNSSTGFWTGMIGEGSW